MTPIPYPITRPEPVEPAWWANATDDDIETVEWLAAVVADGEPEEER